MGLYTRFVSGLVFPVQEALKGHTTVAVRREMEKNQWLPAAELSVLQLAGLRGFLEEIGSHVPYYRSLFQKLEFQPGDVCSLNDLQRLPLMGKAEIRAHTEEMKSDRASGLARFNTGGSSGEPLIFYIGKKRVSHDVAAKWRATRWWDVDIGDREIVVWGSPIELGSQDRVRLIRDALMRTRLLPAFEMSDENLDRFITTIRSVRPPMLFGYPSALSLIAGHAKNRGVALDKMGIKVVFVTSEALYEHQREVMEDVFGCPVANGYGGRDAGFIAHQCPSGGMHITAEDIIVETIGEDGLPVAPGERGEIVVTHLATADFPFLRYRTGDIGVLGQSGCACGRGLPLLQEVSGRSTDFLISVDGAAVHGLALIYILRDLPGIESFKVVQETLESTLVYIVRNTDYEQANDSKIAKVFRSRLGENVLVDLRFVDAIPAEKSGKFRYVVSHVKQ